MVGLNPYLLFNGTCEEALNFYKNALGSGVIQMMRFKEAPTSPGMPEIPENLKEKVLHAFFKSEGVFIMASDSFPGQEPTAGNNVSLSIGCTDATKGEKIFKSLSEKAKIIMPFAKTFWSDGYGLLVDQFGISWMVNVESEKNMHHTVEDSCCGGHPGEKSHEHSCGCDNH